MDNELYYLATEIRAAQTAGENTAERVGSLLQKIVQRKVITSEDVADLRHIKDLGAFDSTAAVMEELNKVEWFRDYNVLLFCVNRGDVEDKRGTVLNVKMAHATKNGGAQYIFFEGELKGRWVDWYGTDTTLTFPHNTGNAYHWEYLLEVKLTERNTQTLRVNLYDPIFQVWHSFITLPAATTTQCGLMTSGDKAKLNGCRTNIATESAPGLMSASLVQKVYNSEEEIAEMRDRIDAIGAVGGESLALTATPTGATLSYTSEAFDLGESVEKTLTIPLADSENAGLMTAAEKTRLATAADEQEMSDRLRELSENFAESDENLRTELMGITEGIDHRVEDVERQTADVRHIKDLGAFDSFNLATVEFSKVLNFTGYSILLFQINNAAGQGTGAVINVRSPGEVNGAQYLFHRGQFKARWVHWYEGAETVEHPYTSDWKYLYEIRTNSRSADKMDLSLFDPIYNVTQSTAELPTATTTMAGLLSAADKTALDALVAAAEEGSRDLGALSPSALNSKLNEMCQDAESVAAYSGRWTAALGGNLVEIVQIPTGAEGGVVQYVQGCIGATKLLDEGLTQSTVHAALMRTVTDFTSRSGWMQAERGGFMHIGTDPATLTIRNLALLEAGAAADSAMTDPYTGTVITAAMLDICMERGWSLKESGGARIEVSLGLNEYNMNVYVLTCMIQRYNNSPHPTVFTVTLEVADGASMWVVSKASSQIYLGDIETLKTRVTALEQAAQ